MQKIHIIVPQEIIELAKNWTFSIRKSSCNNIYSNLNSFREKYFESRNLNRADYIVKEYDICSNQTEEYYKKMDIIFRNRILQ